MMGKPQPQVEVAIRVISPGVFVSFYATPDAASEFAEFGKLDDEGTSKYILWVDTRYNFNEVVEYIKGYND